MTSYPYARGTATVRVNTARLRPGNAVLTRDNGPGKADPRTAKIGAVVRTVERTQFAGVQGYRRASRRYDVLFTDGTWARNLAPIQTWAAIADTVG